jgi:autotransporter-associated beta strand protein
MLTVAHSGAIAGGLTVNQTGSALLDQTGTITGTATIGAGASVQVGNNDANGSLPSGAVANDGSLVFNQSADVTAANTISGAGTLTKNNINTLTLSANNNSFAGGATVNSGTLQVVGTGGNSGLGKGNTTVNTNATLIGGGADAFGYAPAHNNPATILINGGTVTVLGTSSYRITMPNLTFTGGTLTSAPGNNGDAAGGNYSLFGNTTCTVASLSNNTTAVISAGKISIQNPTTFDVAAGGVVGGGTPGVDLLISSVVATYNNVARGVTKMGAGVLALDANNTFSGGLTINNGTLQLGTAADAGNLTSPLGTGAVVDNATINFASSQTVTVNNTITGTGALVVSGGSAVLGASDSYAGNTSVNAGSLALVGAGMIANQAVINVASNATLDVSARSDGTLTLASGQTLSGAGTVVGIVSASAGATVAPGSASATGKLTVTSDTTLSGTTTVKIDKAHSTNDVLSVGGNLTYGGTLDVTTLSGTIALNNSFKLFNAANYIGAFTAIVPATPGAGLAWNTNNLTINGTLSVSSTGGTPPPPTIQKLSVAAGNVVLSGTNNAGPGGTFSVLTSTNLSVPLTNWTVLTNGTFDSSGNFSITNATGGSRQFYLLQVP